MIGVFDFDGTTGITVAKETPCLWQFRNVEFATNDILSARPTRLLSRMKGYRKVCVLTARGSGNGLMREALRKYFKRNGVYLPSSKIITVGDFEGSTAEKKQFVLSGLVRRYGKVDFYDDDSNNVELAKAISGVRSHAA